MFYRSGLVFGVYFNYIVISLFLGFEYFKSLFFVSGSNYTVGNLIFISSAVGTSHVSESAIQSPKDDILSVPLALA